MVQNISLSNLGQGARSCATVLGKDAKMVYQDDIATQVTIREPATPLVSWPRHYVVSALVAVKPGPGLNRIKRGARQVHVHLYAQQIRPLSSTGWKQNESELRF